MVRLGIAGTGGMAEYQAKKFALLPDCVLSACKDHKLDHARAFAQRFAIPLAFDSIADLLDSGSCDALYCAVLDSRHRDIAGAALARGFPVLCEKPLARTLADSRYLAELAEKTGLPTMVNFSKRNAPALHALRAILDAGRLGTLLSVTAEYRQGWVTNLAWGDWRIIPRWRWRLLPGESTGGVLGDLGSHLADALLFLFGGLRAPRPSSALSLDDALATRRLGAIAVPDEFRGHARPVLVAFSAEAETPAGCPVRLSATWIDSAAADEFALTLRGSRATAVLDLRRSRDGVYITGPAGRTTSSAPGPAVLSTYAQFVSRCAAYRSGDGAPPPAGIPDFAHAAGVQGLLAALAPGGLPE